MINKVILIGNVGADPEIRYINEDLPVARVRLATSEVYTNKQGEKVENTEWHNIVLWRGLAKLTENYVVKGTKLYIEGKITYRQYEQDGTTKYFTEIVANELRFLSRKSDTDSQSSAPSSSTKSKQANPSQQSTVAEPDIDLSNQPDDDLPF
ncbi:MAG: single-stranded DNA-binding protein [Bacteroidales bacterium]|jgi:single-strand DNA-binding protein|nr:single-stranded DNA-binding protein [Bacteroidales bacterium]